MRSTVHTRCSLLYLFESRDNRIVDKQNELTIRKLRPMLQIDLACLLISACWIFARSLSLTQCVCVSLSSKHLLILIAIVIVEFSGLLLRLAVLSCSLVNSFMAYWLDDRFRPSADFNFFSLLLLLVVLNHIKHLTDQIEFVSNDFSSLTQLTLSKI